MTGSSVGCAGARGSGIICTNSTGKPIFLSIYGYSANGSIGYLYLYISGVMASGGQVAAGKDGTVYGVVPPGANYYLALVFPAAIGGSGWTELR
jgi:hypothetical protein